MTTKLQYFFLLLATCSYILPRTKAYDICNDTTVNLNEELSSCCQGKPTFNAENCLEKMVENSTVSEECIVDCMFKSEFEIYDGENINLEAVKNYVEKNFNDADIREMLVNAFAQCNEMGKERILDLFHTPNLINEHNCDNFPIHMDRCVSYHVLSHCPERMGRANPEKCAQQVEWIEQCFFN